MFFSLNLLIKQFTMLFSENLLWDSNVVKLDFEKNAAYIIERALTLGTWDDFREILKFYGKERVKREVVNLRHIDDLTLHFSSTYFDIPLTDFRCYNIKLSKSL